MNLGTLRRKRIVGRTMAHLMPDGIFRALCGQASGSWIDAHPGDEVCATCTALGNGTFTRPSVKPSGPRFTQTPLADGHRELLLALSLAGDTGLKLSNHEPAELRWLNRDRMAVQFAPAGGGALRWKLTGRGAEALKYDRYLEG